MKVAQQLVASQLQLEHSFKKRLVREAEFKKQKLDLVDKQLDAARFMARSEEARANEDMPKRVVSPSRSQRPPAYQSGMERCWSSPGKLGGPVPSAWSPSMRVTGSAGGWACGRMAAGVPLSAHPVPHPGTRILNPTMSRTVSVGFYSAPDTPDKTAEFARSMPRTPSAPSRPTSRPGIIEPDEDTLEADLEMAAMEYSSGTAGASRGLQATPDMIERLGDLMACLGPRYRTLNKEAMWERACRGETSAFQRRLAKERELGAATKRNPLKAALRRDPGAALEVIEPDPEQPARVSWLDARRRGRHENQAALEAALNDGSGAAPVMGSSATSFQNLPLKQ
eukprot:TRINITY_DN93773_c0_g1_i1.p1 TRINITY_DN93773_c0_g1~~TRINITY_DN93773_c0_g1_i1.p1  ORF type:complete len:339 (+),score=66.47 TRINITY_DN93773_c0_g1_i1:161-1177(+)